MKSEKGGDRVVFRRLKSGKLKAYNYPAPATVGAVITEYRKSLAYRKLKPSTKTAYERALDLMKEADSLPIAKIRRRNILQRMDELGDTPGLATRYLRMWQTLLKFAVEREYIEHSVAAKIPVPELGSHERWSDEAVEFALRCLPERFRNAALLAVYTGQRAGDLVKIRWSDTAGETLHVIQEKTGTEVFVPVHPTLGEALKAWPRISTHILTDSNGRPWRKHSFCAQMSKALRAHPKLNGCVFHGLRATAASRLAEAGCSTHEIAAITGHKSLAQVEKYTKGVSQRTLAKAAILKLEKISQKSTPQRIEKK